MKQDKQKMRAEMVLRAYERQKRYGTLFTIDWNSITELCVGYQSSIADFEGTSIMGCLRFIFAQLISLGYLSYFDRVKSAIPHDPNKGPSLTSHADYRLNFVRSHLSSGSVRR